mmetsp:Transcript_105280/g.293091  ORF Transcript_105280/g.293091 Transcript_105280/m.293091 type:complete len:253 (+) Transcript_105280:45-803(+)
MRHVNKPSAVIDRSHEKQAGRPFLNHFSFQCSPPGRGLGRLAEPTLGVQPPPAGPFVTPSQQGQQGQQAQQAGANPADATPPDDSPEVPRQSVPWSYAPRPTSHVPCPGMCSGLEGHRARAGALAARHLARRRRRRRRRRCGGCCRGRCRGTRACGCVCCRTARDCCERHARPHGHGRRAEMEGQFQLLAADALERGPPHLAAFALVNSVRVAAAGRRSRTRKQAGEARRPAAAADGWREVGRDGGPLAQRR